MSNFLGNNWANLIGWCLATISIVYAFYESKKNKELKELARVNNWILYQRTDNIGGTIGKILEKAHEQDIDRDLFENIVKSDALCGELMKENIRLIYMSEPSFTQNDINKWVCEGKISVSGGYDKIFKKYMIDDK